MEVPNLQEQSWKGFRNLKVLLKRAQGSPAQRLCVAAADDLDTLLAIKEAMDLRLVTPVLVGDRERILATMNSAGLERKDVELMAASDPVAASRLAANLVGCGDADILMKGKLPTADLMRAILDPASGLRIAGDADGGRGRRLISHLALLDVQDFDRLIGITDAGINIAPDLEAKKDIIRNAAEAIGILLGQKPRVAALAALEKVNQAMPATVDARNLEEAALRGELGDVFVQGPLALDCAVDMRAAKAKGLSGDVAGRADVLLAPDIESGNIAAKSIIYFANASMAGILVGTRAPVVVNSRADVPSGRLASILCGVVLAQR